MNISAVKNLSNPAVLKFTTSRGALLARKFGPQIMTGAGIVGVVTSAVLASKATLRLEEVVDRTAEGLDDARHKLADDSNDFTTSDYNKAVANVYFHRSIDILKLYGPSITLGVASIALIAGGQGIMTKRAASYAAAYKVSEEGFAKYRKAVQDLIGEDEEKKLRYAVKEETITNSEGQEETVVTVNPIGVSQYARYFDETRSQWVKNPDVNRSFLINVQNWCNDTLNARGHIFLNEVYERLGFDHSKEGAVMGWVRRDNPGAKDGYVDFGIYDGTGAHRLFVNGLEDSVLLDFNVDGIILDLI